MTAEYEAVIGLEVHVELKTGRKIFCSCPAEFGAEPNTNVCPVCLGMPGTLPVLDAAAVEFAVLAGLALNCHINQTSWFDRKNYFYPDLPKGYQITQYDCPICCGGFVPIDVGGSSKRVRLSRIHLEEDAGKLTHRGGETEIDYNRCGVPLIEIVSEPDMRTSEEAKAYLTSLRRILLYTGVSDCRMNEGSLRCDVNVSLRRRGTDEYGVKCEIKNLNSINYVGRALEFEIRRQLDVLERGGEIECETRRYNEERGVTERMRKKEGVVDYRYFAEPNIPPLYLSNAYLEDAKRRVPKLPEEVSAELIQKYGLRRDAIDLIIQSPKIVRYFEEAARHTEYKAICANLLVGEILPKIVENDDISYIKPEFLGEISNLLGSGQVVSGNAKRLIHLSKELDASPREIAECQKMLKITDESILMPIVKQTLEANPKTVSDILRGKPSAKKQLIGYAMRATNGNADPAALSRLITQAVDAGDEGDEGDALF